MSTAPGMLQTLDEIRAAFDRGFAEPPRGEPPATEGLLALRAGRGRYALRANEISALVRDLRVVALPGRAPGFMGIAGHRGEVMPVYSLRALLGSPGDEPEPWLALGRNAAGECAALAFEDYEGLRMAEAADITPLDAGAGPLLDGALREPEGARAIVSVRALLGLFKRNIEATSCKERAI